MTKDAQQKERIAKYLARRGIASRRGAEQLILEGRISVNGKVLESPAFNVSLSDDIRFDGEKLTAKIKTKLYRYYKPKGLVTTHKDEKGRENVFDSLPQSMGRVISIGRLDLNSEGLLLLTNDGELARHLELPSTGWSRIYKVRAFGNLTEDNIAELEKGITIEGVSYAPAFVKITSRQGQNFWSEVTLKEGKNREIRKLFSHFNCEVNRLIRTSYGAFHLGKLKDGEVEEISEKVMKEQLGNWKA